MREHDIPRLIFTVVIDQLYIPPFDSSSTWQRLVGESSKKKEKSGTGKVNHTAKYFSRKAANRERTTKRVAGVGARKANARKNSRLVDNNDGSLLREYSCNRPPRLMTATPFPLSLRLHVFALSLFLFRSFVTSQEHFELEYHWNVKRSKTNIFSLHLPFFDLFAVHAPCLWNRLILFIPLYSFRPIQR